MKLPRSKAETPAPAPQQAATRVQPAAPAPRKRRSKQRLWLATGFAVGVFVLLIVWLDRRQQAREEAEQQPANPVKEQEAHRAPPAPRFDFYQELPAHGTKQAEGAAPAVAATPVRPAPLPAPVPAAVPQQPAPPQLPLSSVPAVADPIPAPNGEFNSLLQQLESVHQVRYVLQAGSWSTPEGASVVRERLKAEGLNTSVESVQIGKKTFYRVMVGPFSEKAAADSMQQRLRNAGFNPLQRRLE